MCASSKNTSGMNLESGNLKFPMMGLSLSLSDLQGVRGQLVPSPCLIIGTWKGDKTCRHICKLKGFTEDTMRRCRLNFRCVFLNLFLPQKFLKVSLNMDVLFLVVSGSPGESSIYQKITSTCSSLLQPSGVFIAGCSLP